MGDEMHLVGFRPAPKRRARALPPCPAGTLAGRGERNLGGRQGSQTSTVIDSRLPGEPGVDDDAHPWNGQRTFRNGGGQDHPASGAGLQHQILLRRRLSAEQPHNEVEISETSCHCVDLGLTGKEYQDVARSIRQGAAHHARDVLQQSRVHPGVGQQRDGPRRWGEDHLDRVHRAAGRHDRCWMVRCGENRCEPVGVGGGRGGDQPQIGP